MTGMQRIGDAERDAAVAALREHASAGRITFEEFTERMTLALEARTQDDIARLFADLPGGSPGEAGPKQWGVLATRSSAGAPVERQPRQRDALEIAKVVGVTAIWIAFFVGVFTGVVAWWLFWIPILASGVLTDEIGKKDKKNKEPPGTDD